jgi:glycerol kinase
MRSTLDTRWMSCELVGNRCRHFGLQRRLHFLRTARPSQTPTANTQFKHPQPGWAELDSRRAWECERENIAEVVARVRKDPIRALCVSSMGEVMASVTLN